MEKYYTFDDELTGIFVLMPIDKKFQCKYDVPYEEDLRKMYICYFPPLKTCERGENTMQCNEPANLIHDTHPSLFFG